MENISKTNHQSLPLNQLIKDALNYLQLSGYAKETTNGYHKVWKKFSNYARYTFGQEYFSKELVDCFMSHYQIPASGEIPISRAKRRIRRAILGLLEFDLNRAIPRRTSPPLKDELPVSLQTTLDEYTHFCRKKAGIRKSTMRHRKRNLRQYLHFIASRGIRKPEEMEPAVISDFVASLPQLRTRTMATITSDLRSFMRYLHMQGILISDLSPNVPKVRIRPDDKIPAIWTKQQVERLLAVVDRSSPKGKRDYAILLLAARLGMRGGDIKKLCIEHIRWDDACIEMPQSKTGEIMHLPLPEEVGLALIDYLRNGRPPSERREVFLRTIAPYEPLCEDSNLHYIVSFYIRLGRIQINVGNAHGPHSLRHTLASHLLADGVAIETIAGILGHRSVESTRIYTKVDMKALKAVALDPEEVFHA